LFDRDCHLDIVLGIDNMAAAMSKVSVIMNMVNEDRDYLILAIESYLRQPNCELIISTVTKDKNIHFVQTSYPECKLIAMNRSKHPIKDGQKIPRGSFMQLNNALKLITGDWFTFASSNDVSYENKLSLEVETCLKNNKEVCYSAYDFIDAEGAIIAPVYFHDYDWDKHLRGNFVADCSMISKRLVDKYLPFNLRFNNYAYWDLWLRIRKKEGDVFCYNPVPTWGYRQDPDAMHVQRLKDPRKIAQANADKHHMLQLHR